MSSVDTIRNATTLESKTSVRPIHHESASYAMGHEPTPGIAGIGLAGNPFARRFDDAPHNTARLSGRHQSASPPLHLHQCGLRLGQPERHVHGPIQGDGYRLL